MLSDAYQALHELADAETKQEADRALRDLARLGSVNRQFAGAVRTVVEQELGMSWQQVEQAAS